jgi:hypothetical protein
LEDQIREGKLVGFAGIPLGCPKTSGFGLKNGKIWSIFCEAQNKRGLSLKFAY